MRLVPCLVVGALTSAVAMSCTLPNLDEYTTPDAGAPATLDAGADGEAGITHEAGIANEGGTPADGGSDGNAPPTCSVDYCTSFPDGSTLDEFQTEPATQTRGGTIAIDDGRLHAKVPVHTSGDAIVAMVNRILSTTAKSAVIECDMRIDQADGAFTGSVSIFELDFIGENGSTFDDFQLYIGKDYADLTPLRNPNLYTPDQLSADIPRGRSFHLRFEGDLTASSGSYKVLFDGIQVGSRSGIAFGSNAKGVLRLGLGISANNVISPELNVTYDNLTVDLQ